MMRNGGSAANLLMLGITVRVVVAGGVPALTMWASYVDIGTTLSIAQPEGWTRVGTWSPFAQPVMTPNTLSEPWTSTGMLTQV